jgi:hypothetical protein
MVSSVTASVFEKDRTGRSNVGTGTRVANNYPKEKKSTLQIFYDTNSIGKLIYTYSRFRVMQVLFKSGITNAANERGILSGSPAGGPMILFSYQRFCYSCDL